MAVTRTWTGSRPVRRLIISMGTTSLDGGDEDLDGFQTGEEVDDLHGLLDDPDSALLGTIVTVTGGHHHVGEAFNKGARCLLESTFLVASGGEGNEHSLLDVSSLEVALERDIGALNVVVLPLAEKFGGDGKFGSTDLLDLFVFVFFVLVHDFNNNNKTSLRI